MPRTQNGMTMHGNYASALDARQYQMRSAIESPRVKNLTPDADAPRLADRSVDGGYYPDEFMHALLELP